MARCAKSSMVLVFAWCCMCMSLLRLYLACSICSLICEQVSLHVILVHPVRCRTMSHQCTCICNESWRDDIKSRNLLAYHDAFFSLSDAGDWERGQGFKTVQSTFQAKMQAPGTINENYVEVTGRLRWVIWIGSYFLWDLSWLEGRSVQFS